MSAPAAAVTSGGAVSVFSGSTTPSVGRRSRLETPALTCWATTWVTATAVVSLPVPAVVGMAMSGLSGPGTGHALPHRLVHVVQQRGRVARQKVHRLARVDRAAAAHRDEAVDLLGARVVGGLLHGAVGRLDGDAVEHVAP